MIMSHECVSVSPLDQCHPQIFDIMTHSDISSFPHDNHVGVGIKFLFNIKLGDQPFVMPPCSQPVLVYF